MRVGIASDHAGFELKEEIKKALPKLGHRVTDYGPSSYLPDDDYPDFVAPLARSIASGKNKRGIAICGSGVGACITANKIKNVRAALVTEYFSAHQGVEDDDMNVLCLGAKVVSYSLALDLVKAFLKARFIKNKNHKRRLRKIESIERDFEKNRRKK